MRYSLCATDKEGSQVFRLNDKKEIHTFMTRNSLKELDEATSVFASFVDLTESFNEVYNQDLKFYNPVIAVSNDDGTIDNYLGKIVYSSDKRIIDDAYNIKLWAYEYLCKNPDDILWFKGLEKIWKDKYNGCNLDYNVINNILLAYFNNWDYSKVREVYFTLKDLDGSKVIKSEIHK